MLAAESAQEVEAKLAEGEGRIIGQVFDKETGAPVRGVAIAVEGTEFGTITDETGNFKLNALPEGTYTTTLDVSIEQEHELFKDDSSLEDGLLGAFSDVGEAIEGELTAFLGPFLATAKVKHADHSMCTTV